MVGSGRYMFRLGKNERAILNFLSGHIGEEFWSVKIQELLKIDYRCVSASTRSLFSKGLIICDNYKPVKIFWLSKWQPIIKDALAKMLAIQNSLTVFEEIIEILETEGFEQVGKVEGDPIERDATIIKNDRVEVRYFPTIEAPHFTVSNGAVTQVYAKKHVDRVFVIKGEGLGALPLDMSKRYLLLLRPATKDEVKRIISMGKKVITLNDEIVKKLGLDGGMKQGDVAVIETLDRYIVAQVLSVTVVKA